MGVKWVMDLIDKDLKGWKELVSEIFMPLKTNVILQIPISNRRVSDHTI